MLQVQKKNIYIYFFTLCYLCCLVEDIDLLEPLCFCDHFQGQNYKCANCVAYFMFLCFVRCDIYEVWNIDNFIFCVEGVLYSVHSKVFSLQFSLFCLKFSVWSDQFAVFFVQCLMWSVQFAVFCLQSKYALCTITEHIQSCYKLAGGRAACRTALYWSRSN